jgi:hypothetical protein
MFNTFTFQAVDAIQTAKKQFVQTFVPHQELKTILCDFVDAQTAYTKEAIQAGTSAATKTGQVMVDRTPYVKLAEQAKTLFSFAEPKTKK